MFQVQRFTGDARHVLVLAQREALSLGHNHIGTEHLLLGLLDASSGVAAEVLVGSGVKVGDVRSTVERIVGRIRPLHDDAAALRAIGIDLDQVRAAVEETFGSGALDSAPRTRRSLRLHRRRCLARPGHPPFTRRSKKVLELALRQALALHHDHIGAEHLLLGLIAEGEGLACKILVEAGARLEDISRRTLVALGRAA